MSSQTTGAGNGSLIGDLLCLLAQISFSIYLTVFKGLSQKYSPITLNKWMFVYASMCYIPFSYHDVAAIQWSRNIYSRPAASGICGCGRKLPCLYLHNECAEAVAPHCGEHVQLHAAHRGLNRCHHLRIGECSIWKRGIAIALVFLGVYIVTQSKSRKDFEKEGKAV